MRPQVIETSRESPLHRASTTGKLAGSLVLVLGIVLLPRRVDWSYLVPAFVLGFLWVLSRMPFAFVWRRMLLAEFFILGIAVLSLFDTAARPIFLSALAKSNLCVFTMLLLTWTTPFHEILNELRRWRLPGIMVTTLALMVRFLPVLREESSRMQRARASRTFVPGKRLAWSNLTSIIGQLFIRSADRAERIYLAMCARGWK